MGIQPEAPQINFTQIKINSGFDKMARGREFKPGDKVLLYLPIKRGSLLSRYFGPYVVHKRVNDTEYVIS